MQMTSIADNRIFNIQFTIDHNDLAKVIELHKPKFNIHLEALVVYNDSRQSNTRITISRSITCSPSQVVSCTHQLRKELENRHIRVIRTRILVSQILSIELLPQVLYHECQMLTDRKENDSDILSLHGAAMSYRFIGEDVGTIITLRHRGTMDEMTKKVSLLMKERRAPAMNFEVKIGSVIYDSCPMFDEGWL